MFAKKSLLRAALVASSISLLSASQPAEANQWTDLFRDLLAPPAGMTVTSSDPISVRETQITNRIIDAINANKLSPSDTQNLKTQLDRVRSLEVNYRQNGQFGPIEIASLNSELNKVESSLNRMLDTTYSGTVVSTNLDNYETLMGELKQRITASLADGRLTIEEAQALKDQFDHVREDRHGYKSDGVLTPAEANHLDLAIENLKRSLANNTHGMQAWPGINGQQSVQSRKIEDGIATGRILRSEYENLKAEVNRVASQEAQARANGLQLDETISLAINLKNLDQKITASLNLNNPVGGGWHGGSGDWHGGDGSGGGRDIDLRQANLLRKIEDLAANGRLSADEAADLRADYQRLQQLETSYRADDNLSPYELDVLKTGLDSIIVELKEKSDTIAVQYPEIDLKQQQLRQRIDESLARGQIKPSDAQKLLASLKWIASIEAAFRQSGGRLDQAEADRIMADLGRLKVKIDRLAVNPLQNLLNRKADLQRKIDDKLADGQLSFRASRSLKRELDGISYSIQTTTVNGRISSDNFIRISADMDRLNSRISSGRI